MRKSPSKESSRTLKSLRPLALTAIQCKYHEAQEDFTTSTVFKPLLQMMKHSHENPQANISYVLFAHFPNPPQNYAISKGDLEAALATKNEKLKKYRDALTGKIDLDNFLPKISVQFGPSWDEMVASAHAALVAAGIPEGGDRRYQTPRAYSKDLYADNCTVLSQHIYENYSGDNAGTYEQAG